MSSINLPARLAVAAETVPGYIDDIDLVADFLGDQSPHTARAYDGDLRDFSRFLGVSGPHAAVATLLTHGPAAANRVCLKYKIDMHGRGLRTNTVSRRISCLRSVVNLARRLGRISWQLDCSARRGEVYLNTAGPTTAGWDAMRRAAAEQAAGGSLVAVRNRSLIRLTHDLGLRIGEAVSIDLEHVDLGGEKPGVWVLGKGERERKRLSIAENTMPSLLAWLLRRGDDPGPLYFRLDCAAAGPGRLTTRSAARIVGKLAKRAGIERTVSPHQLRHHAITEVLIRNGGNVFKAQRFSRHKDLNTLRYYIDAIEDYAGEMAALISDED